MSVAIIPDFVKYQIDWLTSHKGLEFEPVIEDTIVQMLKDTGKSFIDEQAVETSQFDHIAESDRKVSISCAHENDVISRKAAIDAVNMQPTAQPTLCGYNIEHLILIANVLRKENLPPERVAEALTDIGRIVSIVKDEFEESLRKAVEQCKV